MDLKTFSKANRTRCEHPEGFNHPLATWTLSDWFTATMGELGEAANVARVSASNSGGCNAQA